MTEVRSPQRKLSPDIVGPDKGKQTSLGGIARKAKTNKQYRFQRKRDRGRDIGDVANLYNISHIHQHQFA